MLDARLRCGSSFRVELHQYLRTSTPVASLPGPWSYRVRAGTSWLDIGILLVDEIARLICNLYLSVAARPIVRADPTLSCTSMLLGRETANQQQQQRACGSLTAPPFSPLRTLPGNSLRGKKLTSASKLARHHRVCPGRTVTQKTR